VALLDQAVPQLPDPGSRDRVKAYAASLPRPTPANLAIGALTRASVASQGVHVTDMAVDGDRRLTSYWSGEKTPSWFEADLGGVHRVDRVEIILYWDGTRYYQYTVDVSTDGQAWRTVVDQRANTTPSRAEGFAYTFAPVETRYVRVNIQKNSANPGAHIVELGVGEAAAKPGR